MSAADCLPVPALTSPASARDLIDWMVSPQIAPATTILMPL